MSSVSSRHAGAPAWIDDPAAPDILAEIVHVQREYVRDGDPQRMWDLLLDAVLRTSGSDYGFIGEMEWSDRGIPSLTTRAMVWLDGPDDRPLAPHPDIGLLVSQVIADQAPVLVNLSLPPKAESGRFSPVAGFMGLPLVSADRLVGVVGVTGPSHPYDQRLADILQPLLSTCASIIESLQAAMARDRAMAELERSATFLQTLFTSAAQGIIVVDADGMVDTVNPAAKEIFGPSLEALRGRPLSDLVEPSLRRRTGRLIRGFLRGLGPRRLTALMVPARRLDGTSFPAEASVSTMTIDDTTRLVVFIQDVSERLANEGAVRRAADVLDATPDLVAWAEMGGDLVYVNRSGRTAMGLDVRGTLEGRRLLDLFPEDERERCLDEIIPQAVRSGSWSGESRYLAVDGGEIPVSMVVLTETDALGRGYLAVLARDMRQRYELDRLKDAFISNVSHELRTPLTSILGYLELMLDEEGLTDTQRGMLEVIERSGERLLTLIGDILKVSALGRSGPGQHRSIPVDRIIAEVVDGQDATAGRKGVWLGSACEEGMEVVGDELELVGAIGNLVANALKFTSPAGSVEITASASDGMAVIEIADNGIGIPADEVSKVFGRFFRASNARQGEVQGTGLGLDIVQSVVQAHRGSIDIASELGVGTTVTVRLPLA